MNELTRLGIGGREDGPWHFQQYLVEAVVVCLGVLPVFADDKVLP